MAVSLGRSGRVTARVTFDRKKAEEGGFILAGPEFTKADLEAIRMSEAVVATSGGLLSVASLAAREHAVPAVIVGGAAWKDGVLILQSPVFGAPKSAAGFHYQAVEKTVPVPIHEGDVVSVDPQQSAFSIYPPQEHEGRLSLAQAMRAYDGLRDPRALILWYEGAAKKEQAGPWLVSELAQRAARGAAGPGDLDEVLRAVKVSAAPALSAVRERSLAAFLRDMKEAERALKTAGTADAAAHLRAHALSRWEGLSGLGPAPKAAASAFRKVDDLAKARLKALAGSRTGLAEAAAAGGAVLPRRVELPGRLYRRFMEEGGLDPLISDLAGNASLGLRRKSERIRAAIRMRKMSPGLAQEVLALVPPAWTEFSAGGSETSRERLEASLKDAWASLWSPASLGARERQGRSLSLEDAGTYLQELVKGEVSGVMLSRDPASGSRARMAVNAASDQYVIDPEGREALPALVADRETGRVLDGEALKRLALLAAAIEDHLGTGAELRFCFSGKTLHLLGVRALPEEGRLKLPAARPSVLKASPDIGVMRPLAQ